MFCFQLKDKKTGEIPVLNSVDEEICKLLEESVSKKEYCPIFKHPRMNISWYDTIGLALATGKTYDEIKQLWENENCQKVINFLESKYEPISFYSPC